MVLNKKNYILVGGIILIAVIVAGFVFYSGQPDKVSEKYKDTPYGVIAENNGAVLMADTGLDVEETDDRRRQIFERYRLVSKEDFENFVGNEVLVNSIDITEDNAEALLTYPSGVQENLELERPYIRFSILPPESAGEYKLDIKLNSGEEYNFEFKFQEPQKVALVDTGKTRTSSRPATTYETSSGHPEEESEIEAQLHGYRLGSLDLENAVKVFYIDSDGIISGGSLEGVREKANINKYFWLDTELLELNYKSNQELINSIKEKNAEDRSRTEMEYLKIVDRPTLYEHIFLAKKDGQWHYAVVNYPEGFKHD